MRKYVRDSRLKREGPFENVKVSFKPATRDNVMLDKRNLSMYCTELSKTRKLISNRIRNLNANRSRSLSVQ